MALGLDKDNLHHAYLLEGGREEILEELLIFLERSGISTTGNPEFMHIHADSFKMDDARGLRLFERERSFSKGKKIFVITANSILIEAQQSLLKIFEEPVPDTHFFVIVPDSNALLKTLVSRFHVIRTGKKAGTVEAEKFISLRPSARIEFIKELVTEEEESQSVADGTRAKALSFLNSLESALKARASAADFPVLAFEQIFKARRYLRMPGSSVKNLLESVALVVPVIQ